jgi:hypothetical protein
MRTKYLMMLVIAGMLGLATVAGVSFSKPDKVGGENVPEGRIPQEIKNNRYPRSYFPNTEKLGSAEMQIIALGTAWWRDIKWSIPDRRVTLWHLLAPHGTTGPNQVFRIAKQHR